MRRLEGHSIKKSTRKKSLKEEMNTTTINKSEKLVGLDQQKPEGSEMQKARNITYTHEHGKDEHTKNRQRRMRQKQNKHNFMNIHKMHEYKKQTQEQHEQEGRGSDTGLRQATAPSPAAKRKSAG